ncbi:MAG TPA: hypothetical protein VID26_11265 [Candidatus Limnocylindrales bacterium]
MTQPLGDQWVRSAGHRAVLLAASDPNIVVRRYVGKQDQAFADFQVDAAQMARAGWFPTVQHYLPGSWPAGAIFIAFLLILFVFGILVLVYMLIFPPDGALVVSYEYQGPPPPAPETVQAWIRRVGKDAARASVETDLRNQDITRTDYAARMRVIDELELD